jgi:hypothetical protein
MIPKIKSGEDYESYTWNTERFGSCFEVLVLRFDWRRNI